MFRDLTRHYLIIYKIRKYTYSFFSGRRPQPLDLSGSFISVHLTKKEGFCFVVQGVPPPLLVVQPNKMTVTVFSSGCLQIGFGVPIIDYICNFLI